MELNYSITVFDMFSSNIQNIIFCKFQNSELNLENIGGKYTKLNLITN